MAGRLTTWVHLRNPDTYEVEAFGPGSDVPDWAAALITNPKAWEGGVVPSSSPEEGVPASAPASQPAADDGPPPRRGAGSSKQVWAAYAESRGVSVPDDASRDDIIAACESVGVEVG